jgi:trehalose 6-phosphate synthase
MARLVVVSNRVPLPGDRGPKAGGLAVALRDAVQGDGLWFGWSGKLAAETSAVPKVATARRVSYATIDLGEAEHRRYYVGYANSTLWPVLHYRLGLVEFERENLQGYLAVNEAFARALAPLLRPDDLIWVHDYHLIPLGAALRRLGLNHRIGFFLHVPFPPPALLGVLPNAADLLRALVAYDLIGLQTRPDLRNVLDCFTQILGATVDESGQVILDDRAVAVDAFPIGIDADAMRTAAMDMVDGPEARRLKESLSGRRLVIGADRLDYSKGLPNRFEGFARLLSRFPEHRRAVTFLQVAALSREEVPQYRALRHDLDRLTGRINGKYAEFDWIPLRYITRAMARRTLAGFFRIARVGLVTPLRDGMNLVAKEYVAAQDPDDPGVLVLSSFAGAAQELGGAILVNPYDADAIAEALDMAIRMPLGERRERWQPMYDQVRRANAKWWSRSFVAALAAGAASAATVPLRGRMRRRG